MQLTDSGKGIVSGNVRCGSTFEQEYTANSATTAKTEIRPVETLDKVFISSIYFD